MARSTIQEKLAGASPLNLSQVLSIVEALGEHARLSGIPLPQGDIEQSVWRDRITTVAPEKSKESLSTNAAPLEAVNLSWDWRPLAQAQMTDVLEIIRNAEGAPLATWLPKVLREMLQAEMEISGVLKNAARDTPLNIVRTLESLHKMFPPQDGGPWARWAVTEHNMTVGTPLRFTARQHGAESSPAIIAGMRRSNIAEHVNEYLREVAVNASPENMAKALDHLQAAALKNDAKRLLSLIGIERPADALISLLKHFRGSRHISEHNAILRDVGKENQFRVRLVVEELQRSEAPADVYSLIARGIPYGKHVEYAQHLQESGLEEFANLVLAMKDEPPF
ncbi:hypothetical protein [Streptomyces sp. NPDC056543]|uniref:hypothetical protein n=1 Tax=unclassified Streptomyces TaxID=2593676 RepID=UPI00367BD83C